MIVRRFGSLVLACSMLTGLGGLVFAHPASAATPADVAGQPVPFGAAQSYGAPLDPSPAIVGMAATPSGHGYWLVSSNGGVFSYGDARFYGSTGGATLNKPIVGIAATATGHGYWLVASDGGVFSYGDARFYGSTGGVTLTEPIVGIAATSTAHGYWLAASDGGIFNYGDARFYGSMGGASLTNPVTAIAPAAGGYWLLPTTAETVADKLGNVVTQTLQEGDTGTQVLLLQNELTALGYWTGTPDGSFGDATLQAVWALQKAAGLPPTGITDTATLAALARGVRPTPRSTSGYVIEIDLADDLIMFVDNGTVEWTINTSTGGGYTYTSQGVTSVAITPVGIFNTYRVIDGIDVAPLGTLYRPRFFTGGYAIHGDSIVPPYPVSHGCARVSNEAIDWIWANNLDPIGTEVWVY